MVIYRFLISGFFLLIKVASFFNPRAKKWIEGRVREENYFLEINNKEPLIWFHCASLGEFEQGKPIMESFKKRHPNWLLLITFFSPSGYEVQKDYNLADYVMYLPAENKKNVTSFLNSFNPRIAVFVKYEFWYGYMAELKRNNIPMVFASSSFRSDQIFFKPWGRWFLRQLQNVEMFFVQNDTSKTLLKAHGIKNVEVSGDTRFDRVLNTFNAMESIPFMKDFKGTSKVLIFGSAWEDESKFALKILPYLPKEWKVIFAPHEINSKEIDSFITQAKFGCVRFTKLNKTNVSERILVIDTVGHLARIYRYADIAVVGGGFNDDIHNILEPMVFGAPVAFGPKHTRFMEAELSISAKVGTEINNYEEFETWFNHWSTNPKLLAEGKLNATQFIERNAGATEKISNFLNKVGQIISCQIC